MQSKRWDYLILTAANRSQAKLYRQQLRVREELGFWSGFRQWMVIADPDGKRVGSGGSTICCLLEVLNAQQHVGDTDAWRASFGQRRILIVHGGGFLLLVCRGTEEATCARRELNAHPPKERARFFDFSVNNRGLEVSVC